MRFVLRTFPIHLAANIPLDTQVEIYFMIDLQASCVKPENIILMNLDKQASESISLQYKNKVLVISPTEPLQPITHYQIELVGGSDGLKDITGGTLDSTYTFEFYSDDVKQIKPPLLKNPTDHSEVSELIFNWDPSDQAYFYELEISKSNTFQVLEWPLESSRIYETSVTPEVNLNKGSYYARIRAINREGIRSSYSNPIQFYYVPITVESTSQDETQGSTDSQLGAIQDALGQVNIEDDSLKIIASNPKDLSINVPINLNNFSTIVKEVMIEFDEEIDPNSVDVTNFYVIAQKN